MLTLRIPIGCLFLLLLSPLTSAAFTNGSDRLLANDSMTTNQYLASTDGRFRFYLQGDGNLVLRVVSTSAALWSSATNGKGGVKLNMQSDGNLVLRNKSGSSVWSTKTNGSGGVRLVLQNDGNVVIYTSGGNPVWATGTAQAPADTTRPVITLTGSATMSVTQGSTFTDPGATASDDVDGNITSKIVKTGSVNTATVGTYTLSYNVKDNAGNAATTVTRAVAVTAPADTVKPIITLVGSASMSVTQGSTFTDAELQRKRQRGQFCHYRHPYRQRDIQHPYAATR